jgi:hypothetical protein
MPKVKNLWLSSPTREDLTGAQNYLSLLHPQAASKRLAHRLSRAHVSRAKAKDLLRASDLPLLPREEAHVKEDLKRLRKGKSLSPVLLVRGDMAQGVPLVIADGYHRICAVCYFDEDAPIACRLVPMLR